MVRRVCAFGLIALIFFCGIHVLFANPKPEEAPLIEELKLFSKAIGVIHEAFVGDVKPREMLYSAVKGMMGSLDKHSEFIEPERYELLKIHMRGEYAGIGAILQKIDDKIFIRAVEPGKPAEKAGLLGGDQILKVDNQSVEKMEVTEVSGLLRGDENTPVTVTIFRRAGEKTLAIKINREKIEISAIQDEKMIGQSLGYFRIAAWQDNTVEQSDLVLEKLKKEGMQALIIDLRNNDGGLLTAAVGLSERFLKKDQKIVTVESKIEEQRKEYVSSGDRYSVEIPVVILLNEKSASASEVFSGALQDHKRAFLIGVTTYGKGSVQSVIPLDDSSGMKLTTARYLSPSGKIIDKVGLTPDLVVENGPEGTPGSDLQILEAIAYFKQFM